MNVLEKILEEIEERIKRLKEADNMCRVNAERNRNFESMKYFQSLMFATERAESIIRDIIRSHMDEVADDWIPVEERLPEEHDSIFAKFKGTDMWSNAMFEKSSDKVNVTFEFEDGTRKSGTSYTIDGKWECEKGNCAVKRKVIAWSSLPEPYKAD